MFHFLLTCFILIPPPPSPSSLPCFSLSFFSKSSFPLIFSLADLSSLTIPYEEEEEEEIEEETYDDIDGIDSLDSGSQGRPVVSAESLGQKEPREENEEDIYEVLPGEKCHLLVVFPGHF